MRAWRVICAAVVVAAVVDMGGKADSMVETKNKSDREQILAHIDSIFGAYIARDREKIRCTHTADWIGFQGPSTRIERGIDAYMKNAEKSLAALTGTGYELLDSEVQLHGDLALVYYVARYDYRDKAGEEGSIPLRAIDVYRREKGEWIQCGSHIAVIPATADWSDGSGKG